MPRCHILHTKFTSCTNAHESTHEQRWRDLRVEAQGITTDCEWNRVLWHCQVSVSLSTYHTVSKLLHQFSMMETTSSLLVMKFCSAQNQNTGHMILDLYKIWLDYFEFSHLTQAWVLTMHFNDTVTWLKFTLVLLCNSFSWLTHLLLFHHVTYTVFV